jgi:hypothetical protein
VLPHRGLSGRRPPARRPSRSPARLAAKLAIASASVAASPQFDSHNLHVRLVAVLLQQASDPSNEMILAIARASRTSIGLHG